MYEHIRHWVENERVLIGFDFAFAYPCATKAATFLACLHRQWMPAISGKLWSVFAGLMTISTADYFIEAVARRTENFISATISEARITRSATEQPTNRPGHVAGHNPCSVFKCVGPNQVGPCSVAGMRFLHMIHLEQIADIWPFDTTNVPNRPTVVEIYPRLFLNHAVAHRGNRPIPGTVEELLERYGATLQGTPESWTGRRARCLGFRCRDGLVCQSG